VFPSPCAFYPETVLLTLLGVHTHQKNDEPLKSMRRIYFGFLALSGLASSGWAAAPTIIWASDPVRPGEAVMVRGDGFGKKSMVEVASGSATASGQKNPWKAVPVLQQTDATLKLPFRRTSLRGSADSG
jgi:hypothetical protein